MDVLSGKRLLILGLARQGTALARFALSVGARVTVSDLRSAEQLTSALAVLANQPLDVVLGAHPLSLLEGTDVVAVSGSVPADAAIVQEAARRGIQITNDSLLFMERVPTTTTIGVTGSAGKTTTTTLAGHLCAASGRPTWVGGNIGRPLIADLNRIAPDDIVVQELSSFQLEWWDRSPHVAAVLNITPNHLDRHRTMAAYSAAKSQILRHQTEGDIAILCADDDGAMELRPLVRGRCRLFSRHKPVDDGAFLSGGNLLLRDGSREAVVCSVNDIHLRGTHNILNTLAAATLAESVGVPPQAMREVIADFRGVPHRLEVVRNVGGVQYVNDSIATAPERALAAIEAFTEPLILLAGGRDKDMVWDTWADGVRRRVTHAVLFGALAEKLEEKLALSPAAHDQRLRSVTRCGDLVEAVASASRLAQPGDVVLLAPGGTSYDAYADFAERGEAFRELVQRLAVKAIA